MSHMWLNGWTNKPKQNKPNKPKQNKSNKPKQNKTNKPKQNKPNCCVYILKKPPTVFIKMKG